MDLHTNGGLVTIEEVGAQTIFATEASLAGVGGAVLPVGAPGWAVAMNANMAAGFANVAAGFADVAAGFANVNANLANIHARQINVVASEGDDTIHPLTNNAGIQPLAALFPNTYAELLALSNANNGPAHVLLQFYGLPPNPQATRAFRLRKFLGAK
jgi:hypothetical protein